MKILKILILFCSLLFSDSDYEDKQEHIYRNLDYLNLSNTQYNQIKKILLDAKNEYKIFYTYQVYQEKKLENYFKKDVFNKENYIKEYLELEKKAITIQSGVFSKIHKILSSKQRAKFSHYLEEWELD